MFFLVCHLGAGMVPRVITLWVTKCLQKPVEPKSRYIAAVMYTVTTVLISVAMIHDIVNGGFLHWLMVLAYFGTDIYFNTVVWSYSNDAKRQKEEIEEKENKKDEQVM